MAQPIVDYMMLAAAVSPVFTPDLGELSVDCTLDPDVESYLSVLGGGITKFRPGDNIQILEGGIIMPYCFTPVAPPFIFTMGWYNFDDDDPGIVGIGNFMMPYASEPTSYAGAGTSGFFSPSPSIAQPALFPAGGRLRLRLVNDVPISMVGVPSTFPLDPLNVRVWMKIQHLFPCYA